MTLLLGLPAIFWPMNVLPSARSKKPRQKNTEQQIHRLSLVLTLMAALFFTGAVWALGGDGKLDFGDGLVLVGLFLFWQCFHVFEVLKNKVRQNKRFSWRLPVDLLLLGIGAYGIYLSTGWLVDWLSKIHSGFISARHLGWLTGWLMVLPNGILAFYYAWRGRPEVVYASQVGDGHVSIPLSIGICALFGTISVPRLFQTGALLLVVCALLHICLVVFFGRLPRFVGFILTGAYVMFVYTGLIR
jgi:cation:H+ antiporter